MLTCLNPYLTINPFINLTSTIKVNQRKAPLIFSPSEIDNIISHNPNYSLLFTLLFTTAIRPGELRALRFKHLNGDCSSLTIEDSLDSFNQSKNKTKTIRSNRTLNLPPSLSTKLLTLKEKHKDEDIIFTHNGYYISKDYLNKHIWKKALSNASVAYRPIYYTRHTTISNWVEKSIPLNIITQLAGTSLAVISKHYLSSTNQYSLPEIAFNITYSPTHSPIPNKHLSLTP